MEIERKPWLLWQPQGSKHLQWENACHYHISFSFDRVFLKLAHKVDKDEIAVEFKHWLDWIINLSYVPLITEKASV